VKAERVARSLSEPSIGTPSSPCARIDYRAMRRMPLKLAVMALVVGCGGRIESNNGGASNIDGSAVSDSGPHLGSMYFYCVFEPQILMGGLTGQPCGGSGGGACHYSGTVPAMALVPLPKPVACSGGMPTASSQVGEGSPAESNYESVSLMPSTVYAVLTGTVPHPTLSFTNDPAVLAIYKTWAGSQ
jgi:hypothetical protein